MLFAAQEAGEGVEGTEEGFLTSLRSDLALASHNEEDRVPLSLEVSIALIVPLLVGLGRRIGTEVVHDLVEIVRFGWSRRAPQGAQGQ